MTNPPEAELSRDIYLDLVRLHERMFTDFSELFRSHGLTQPQYNVLRILRGAPPEGRACQAIGAELVNRVPDVTRLLDRLEATGWVSRERCSSDRRVVRSRITPKGLRLLGSLDTPVLETHARQLEGLSQPRREQLRDALRQALQAVNAPSH